jgi:hypothetical protein
MFRSTREFLEPATPSAVPMAMTWCAGRWSMATRRITGVLLGEGGELQAYLGNNLEMEASEGKSG